MQLEKVTPRKAAEWLKRNINNRPLSEAFVNRLAGAMTAGQWQVNGDPIRFDEGGSLIDGQHRLTAVIKSGVTIDAWVLRGLGLDAFDTIDRGHVRTNGDVLARRGEKHYNVVASCSAIWFRYFSGGTIEGGSVGWTPRPDQLDQILNEHGDIIRRAADFAVKNKTPYLPASETAFCFAITSYIWGTKKAAEFWGPVLTADGLKSGTPAYVLHKRLADSLCGSTRLRRKSRLAMCVKAFNAHVGGTRIKCLKHVDGEEFPRFVTPKKAS